jgi:hypothetical protein
MMMMGITVNGTPESRRRIILAHTAIASPHALLTFKGVRCSKQTGALEGANKGRGQKTLDVESLEELVQ